MSSHDKQKLRYVNAYLHSFWCNLSDVRTANGTGKVSNDPCLIFVAQCQWRFIYQKWCKPCCLALLVTFIDVNETVAANSNRIRLTLFSLPLLLDWVAVFFFFEATSNDGREKKTERWLERATEKNLTEHINVVWRAPVKRIKCCWLIGWNVSWQPRMYEQCKW